VVHAFTESPNWSGAPVHVYDEWGGFFDHVRPPTSLTPVELEHRRGLR
jgi:phospholipase C